jgi:hypothetical protein
MELVVGNVIAPVVVNPPPLLTISEAGVEEKEIVLPDCVSVVWLRVMGAPPDVMETAPVLAIVPASVATVPDAVRLRLLLD